MPLGGNPADLTKDLESIKKQLSNFSKTVNESKRSFETLKENIGNLSNSITSMTGTIKSSMGEISSSVSGLLNSMGSLEDAINNVNSILGQSIEGVDKLLSIYMEAGNRIRDTAKNLALGIGDAFKELPYVGFLIGSSINLYNNLIDIQKQVIGIFSNLGAMGVSLYKEFADWRGELKKNLYSVLSSTHSLYAFSDTLIILRKSGERLEKNYKNINKIFNSLYRGVLEYKSSVSSTIYSFDDLYNALTGTISAMNEYTYTLITSLKDIRSGEIADYLKNLSVISYLTGKEISELGDLLYNFVVNIEKGVKISFDDLVKTSKMVQNSLFGLVEVSKKSGINLSSIIDFVSAILRESSSIFTVNTDLLVKAFEGLGKTVGWSRQVLFENWSEIMKRLMGVPTVEEGLEDYAWLVIGGLGDKILDLRNSFVNIQFKQIKDFLNGLDNLGDENRKYFINLINKFEEGKITYEQLNKEFERGIRELSKENRSGNKSIIENLKLTLERLKDLNLIRDIKKADIGTWSVLMDYVSDDTRMLMRLIALQSKMGVYFKSLLGVSIEGNKNLADIFREKIEDLSKDNSVMIPIIKKQFASLLGVSENLRDIEGALRLIDELRDLQEKYSKGLIRERDFKEKQDELLKEYKKLREKTLPPQERIANAVSFIKTRFGKLYNLARKVYPNLLEIQLKWFDWSINYAVKHLTSVYENFKLLGKSFGFLFKMLKNLGDMIVGAIFKDKDEVKEAQIRMQLDMGDYMKDTIKMISVNEEDLKEMLKWKKDLQSMIKQMFSIYGEIQNIAGGVYGFKKLHQEKLKEIIENAEKGIDNLSNLINTNTNELFNVEDIIEKSSVAEKVAYIEVLNKKSNKIIKSIKEGKGDINDLVKTFKSSAELQMELLDQLKNTDERTFQYGFKNLMKQYKKTNELYEKLRRNNIQIPKEVKELKSILDKRMGELVEKYEKYKNEMKKEINRREIKNILSSAFKGDFRNVFTEGIKLSFNLNKMASKEATEQIRKELKEQSEKQVKEQNKKQDNNQISLLNIEQLQEKYNNLFKDVYYEITHSSPTLKGYVVSSYNMLDLLYNRLVGERHYLKDIQYDLYKVREILNDFIANKSIRDILNILKEIRNKGFMNVILKNGELEINIDLSSLLDINKEQKNILEKIDERMRILNINFRKLLRKERIRGEEENIGGIRR